MKAVVTITKFEQKNQVVSHNEFEKILQGTIYFNITHNGKTQNGVYVNVHQPYGTDYETQPLEVSKPYNFQGAAYNHAEFSDEIERYYRSQIGSTGSGINISGDSSGIIMSGNVFHSSYNFTIAIPFVEGSAW